MSLCIHFLKVVYRYAIQRNYNIAGKDPGFHFRRGECHAPPEKIKREFTSGGKKTVALIVMQLR